MGRYGILLVNIFVLAVGLFGYCQAVTDTIQNQKKLFLNLLSDYEPSIPPKNESQLLVNVSLSINHIIQLDEVKETFEIVGSMHMTWTDLRLSWNSSEYNNIKRLVLRTNAVWLPDITLYNGVADMDMFNAETISVYSNGLVLWFPSVRLTGSCSVDLYRFPFDQQICKFKFGSWQYSGDYIDLGFYYVSVPTIDLTSQNFWKLTNATQKRNLLFYPCCPEPYVSLDYTFILSRNPTFYVHSYILPAVILSILVPVQLLLPSESKERLTLGAGCLLGNILMILRFQDVLPSGHFVYPALGIFFNLNLIWCSLTILASIFVLNFDNRGPRQSRVPEPIRNIFLKSLKRIVCLGNDTYYPIEFNEGLTMRGIENKCLSSPGDEFKRAAKNDTKLEKDVEIISNQVQFMTKRAQIEDNKLQIVNEWRQLSIVIDRILFFLFFITYIIYTLSIMA